MKSILRDKKADFASIITMTVIIFTIALASIIFSKAFLDATGELKEQESLSNRSIESIEKVERRTIPLLDFMVFFVMIALFIALIISSIYIRVHPALIVVFIISLIIAVILAGQFANIFNEAIEQPQLVSTAENFTMTRLILTDTAGVAVFPVIIMVVGIVVVVILYGKAKNPEGVPA